jgi:hypothetical protein
VIEFRLTQLQEHSPFHALVAMGVLRVAVEDLGMTGAALSWQGGQARIHAPENLLDELARYAPERGAMPEYAAVGSTRGIAPERYAELAATMPEWMAGIATIAVLTQAGNASSTKWDMTGGRQQLLKDVGAMLTKKLPRKRSWADRLRDGLIDGGAGEEGSSYGLDPEGFRSHALSAYAPSQSNMAQTTPLQIQCRDDGGSRHVAQVWLAVEAFPLHPVLRGPTGRACTAGWQADEYRWCAWDGFLSLQAVRILVGGMGQPAGAWAERGLREYAAPRVSLGKYGAMRMGRRVARS